MNGYKIDLGSSIFERFIADGSLYVDKTLFIEHFLGERSPVLLITRPRRMGKSLNMNMLDAYLDLKNDSVPLFKGLKIESRPCFREHLNRYPVIYMDFRMLKAEGYQKSLRYLLLEHIQKYLVPEKRSEEIIAFVNDSNDTHCRNLLFLTKNLHEAYGEQAVILIDEYDQALMDNVGKSEYTNIRDYISQVFELALKGNPHLYKALLTGVLRVSQESMFSKLNNIKVYDVFTHGPFDEDFGLTEDEVRSLVPEEKFGLVKDWYNNVHVGNSWMFYIYSVLSYLDSNTINNYWGRSGAIDLLGDLMTPDRALQIGEAMKELGASFTAEVDPRVSLNGLFGDNFDKYYYSVAIQAGYLTFERDPSVEPWSEEYKIRLPNQELMHVWRSYILSQIVRDPKNRLGTVFANIADLKDFSESLSEFISFQLSHHDISDQLEKIYHVFVFGMLLTLGYECESNREAGFGRFDIQIKAPAWTASMEFKMTDKEDGLESAAQKALEQIYDKKYLARAPKNKPAYAIGAGCFNKRCVVITEQVW